MSARKSLRNSEFPKGDEFVWRPARPFRRVDPATGLRAPSRTQLVQIEPDSADCRRVRLIGLRDATATIFALESFAALRGKATGGRQDTPGDEHRLSVTAIWQELHTPGRYAHESR